MDQVLLPYLQAADESQRQERLGDLLLLYAAPVVRNTIRQKLGFSLNQKGINPHNQDAQDLYQETMARIIQALNDVRISPQKTGIEDFRKYVSRTTANLCQDFLRARSPARRRLRDNVRLVLIRHPDFAFWKVESEYVCGFAGWQRSGTSPPWSPEPHTVEGKIEEFRCATYRREDPARLPLPRVLSDLFEWIGAPTELDTVVKFLAKLRHVKDDSVESLDEEGETYLAVLVAPASLSPESRVEENEILRQVWDTVKRLPTEQRDAYCLMFHDGRGWDLFSLLLEAEIVSLLELAQVMNRSPQEINRLRSEMPMDGLTAAAELNVARPRVNKWRHLAEKRIKGELRRYLGEK